MNLDSKDSSAPAPRTDSTVQLPSMSCKRWLTHAIPRPGPLVKVSLEAKRCQSQDCPRSAKRRTHTLRNGSKRPDDMKLSVIPIPVSVTLSLIAGLPSLVEVESRETRT